MSTFSSENSQTKPLIDLTEDEVILLLPQITPSKWHEAFRSANLTGDILYGVNELSDLVKYKINFKKLEFESFMNRLAVFKSKGVLLTILNSVSPVKSESSKAVSPKVQTSVATRVAVLKSSSTLVTPSSTLRNKSPATLHRTPSKVVDKRTSSIRTATTPGRVPSTRAAIQSTVRDSYHDRDSPRTPQSRSLSRARLSPARVAAMAPEEIGDNKNRMTRKMSMRKIDMFEKKSKKSSEPIIISAADRENLLKACADGNEDFIQSLIDKKLFDGLSRHGDGRTTVMVAAWTGHGHIVDLLLNQPNMNIILNTRDRDGMTALMLAADKGHSTVLELLLSHIMIDVNIISKDGKNAMMYGARHEISTRLLMKHDMIDINARDHDGMTALMIAIRGNHAASVQLILSHPNININDVDKDGRSVLMLACHTGAVAIIELILKSMTFKALNINLPDSYGMTALILACEHGHITAVQMLLAHDKDIDINIHDIEDRSALAAAMEGGYTDIVALMLQQPSIEIHNDVLSYAPKQLRDLYQQMLLQTPGTSDVNARDKHGNTALLVACNEGKKDTVQLLLQQAAIAVNAQDKHGNTSLMLATKKGKKEIVDMLLAHPNINVNIQDRHGTTALMTASRKGKVPIVEALLHHPSIDVNIQDSNQCTSLLIAAGEGHDEVVDHLLHHPYINVNLKDGNGNNVLLLSSQQGKIPIVELLLHHHDTHVNSQDEYGRSSLMIASYHGNEAMVSLLLSCASVDVNIKDHYMDDTALLLALRNDHELIIRDMMMHKDVDLNARARDDATVLSLASKHGMLSTVRALLKNHRYVHDMHDIYHKYTAVVGASSQVKYDNIIELLISEDPDADFNRIPEEEDALPLLLAAVQGRHKELVQLLMLQQHVDINIRDKYDQTALIIAARRGYKDLVEILVKEHHIDLNARDNDGCTAVMAALSEKMESIAKLLIAIPGLDMKIEDNNGKTASMIAKENGIRSIL